MSGYVYVVTREGDDRVKIGSSIDPPSRLASLQTGSPDRLSIAYTHPVSGSAEAVEARAHEILDRHRGFGEWFSVPVDVAVAAISAAAYQVGESASEAGAPTTEPSWLKRAALIALAFTPGWAALTAGIPILAFPLLFGGLVALVAALARSQERYGMRAGRIVRWIGSITAGLAASMLCGLIVGSAHAEDRPAFPVYDSEAYCSKVVALLNDNQTLKQGCLANEADARDKLQHVWEDPPPSIEIECGKLMGLGSPNNYQAMSGCLALGVGNSWLNGTIKLSE